MLNQSNLNAPIITQSVATNIIKSMIKRKNKRPIMIFGRGGIGKTESVASIAKELEMGYVDVRLLLYTESDLKGVPFVNENHTATVWLQNDILPRADRDGETGILVFDEITSCSKSVRTAAYQLLNERRLGEYVLPDGWNMICLGNGENDGGQFNGMEANFANRCTVLEVIPSVEAWKLWAMRSDVNSLVTSYVSWQENDLHTMNPDEEGEITFASPRSWKAVSDILNEVDFDDTNEALRAEIQGNIGKLVGGRFWAYCMLKDKAIEPAKILEGGVKKYPAKKNQEVIFMTIHALVSLMGRNIKTLVDDGSSVNEISKNKDIVEQCINGIKWILGLPELEYQTMAIKDFIAIDKDVIIRVILNQDFLKACPELLEFTEENEVVFA